MGGKTKHTQRTKNNAKPSSSARSAELLGTAPTFVGFSAHSNLGIIPFAPGFATAEQMPDTFDANISTPYQLTMKKLSKKDPMTKKKALQEFIELINSSEIDELKIILPLWPKFYQNLATDPDHTVRELSQTVLQLLVSKCKKAVAPFLKQLVPVWLASQFDNYAPAASIASTSFNDTFAGNANRIREVCLHCQSEILEYVTLNLTFHSASTLSTGKNLSPEEAEQKYQRILMCCLKELSYFVERTIEAEDQTQIVEGVKKILDHQKFWSFAKNKLSSVRAAWFELIYHLLQSTKQKEIFEAQKSQLITIAFQYIDETEPVVAPHVWGCILLIQTNYNDWHTLIDFEEKVWPKFIRLLRNAFSNNAQAICPNILPFFSQLSHVTSDLNQYHRLVNAFFDNFKQIIIAENSSLNISKQDTRIIIKTYFECVRHLIQKIHAKNEAAEDEENRLVLSLLEENLVAPLKCCLSIAEPYTQKVFFQQISTLVAFFDKQAYSSEPYQQLLSKFWSILYTIITEDLSKQDITELYLERVIDLTNDLYIANPSVEEQKVKFATDSSEEDLEHKERPATPKKSHCTAAFIQKELKQLVIQLLRTCLKKTESLKTPKYVKYIRVLCNMFNDREFYALVTEDTVQKTLSFFISLLDVAIMEKDAGEMFVDVVFEILQKCDELYRYQVIENELIKHKNHSIQVLVLHRLLSHPLCIEKQIRRILKEPNTTEIIQKICVDVVANNSKDLFNLLHKCFFETELGEILISSQAVDTILELVSQPLVGKMPKENVSTDIDACGSFIAQIMPVVCSNENSSKAVQHKVFLRLFRFSLEKSVNNSILEDTLWEITTCWQDALSSEDIVVDTNLLEKCASIVDQQITKDDLTTTHIESMAEAVAKFVTCSNEHVEKEEERTLKIDEYLQAFVKINTTDIQDLLNTCLFIESLKHAAVPSSDFTQTIKNLKDFKQVLQRSLLNFSSLCKLVCKPTKLNSKTENVEANEEEITEDYCDPNENLLKIWSEFLQTQLLQYINIAACGDSLIIYSDKLDKPMEDICLELSERVQLLFRQSGELSVTLKERLLEESAKEENISYCRSLPYLMNIEQYAQFEESATLLLAEDLQEHFAAQKAFKAYINTLKYLLPKLEAKTISMQCPIMQCEPNEIWIKAAVFSCLIENNFSSSYNDKSDHNIIVSAVQFITQHADKLHTQKDVLLFTNDLSRYGIINFLNAVEFINLLIEVLRRSPHQLTIKNWDVVRMGLAHWTLAVTNSLDFALENMDQKSLYFMAHVFKLFVALNAFFDDEKQKSSTELVTSVYDEWKQVFAGAVHLTVFKAYYRICQYQNVPPNFIDCWEIFLNEITSTMEHISYESVYTFCKSSKEISLDHLCNFLLRNLSSSLYSLRTASVIMIKKLTPFFVADDYIAYDKISEKIDKDEDKSMKWHFLNRFEDYLGRYVVPIKRYNAEFSFKLSEIAEMESIDKNVALSYLMLWDCLIHVCSQAPTALRSVYASWLHENKFEEDFLHFLFRCMPAEVLKNHNNKQMNNGIFHELPQMKDPNLSLEHYACHLYTHVLRKLPAVVRKWWNSCPSRQKTFIDALTTNFISPFICQTELYDIASKTDKHENMQVNVHISTREVLAVYTVDEVRMELVITLGPNYPLGSVKVDCNKQIGGRNASRNVAMQLTIFLTHQNGTIIDGLTLWKKNLDKKFEGVEECYICYTVIHQDTCQLPKLTCKTCKKKFHGPCLYKWFTTSHKSTCPICRNVF